MFEKIKLISGSVFCKQFFFKKVAIKICMKLRIAFDYVHTGCGIHNQSAHVKAYYSLTSDLMVTKFHMGVLPTLVDKIMHNNFGSASIWPQQRLSSQVSQKYIEPTLKCQKKRNICCICTLKFLSFNNCFYGFKMQFQT